MSPNGERTVVRPVDAAGLVLIRDGSRGPEILMGRRHGGARFLPGVYVFPGGRVDPVDSRPSGFAEAMPGAVLRQLRRGSRRSPAAFLRAAVRETFEETGLLLTEPTAANLVDRPREPVWRAFARIGAAPGFGAMDYACRAITPTRSTRRYNTRFFLADGTAAAGRLMGNGELEDLDWWPAAETEHLPIVDVTKFVLGEALRRWAARIAVGSQPPPLFSYRKGNATLRMSGNAAGSSAAGLPPG